MADNIWNSILLVFKIIFATNPLFQLLTLLLWAIALVIIAQNPMPRKTYWYYSKNIASIFIALMAIVLILRQIHYPFLLVLLPMNFVLALVFTNAGFYLSACNKSYNLPILLSLGRQHSKCRNFQFWKMFFHVIIWSTFVCVFTYILFKITHPKMAHYLQDQTESFDMDNAIPTTAILFFILIAFYEEIIFRLFTQNFLMRLLRHISFGKILAIILTSIFFAYGHTGILENDWVKLLQTFVIGLVLSRSMLKYGMEASLTIHIILNLFAIFAADYLVAPTP